MARTAREKLLAIATDKNAWPYPEQITSLLDAHRSEVLTAAAAELRAHCPSHGTADTSLITCQCPAADHLDLTARNGA